MKLVVKNISILAQLRSSETRKVAGSAMAILPSEDNSWLYCENGLFHSIGSMENYQDELKKLDPSGNAVIVDAENGMVLPSWCDSHTHIVYATSREHEFVDRIHGLSYEEIASRGGGILNSAKKLSESSEDDLFESAMTRLNEMISFGTGAVEIKSGYGLNFDSELKMLRVIRKIKESAPLPVKATFLGAHAMPPEYKTNRKGYINLITQKMIPAIAEEGLADFCDVFCDRGFFSPEETDEILKAGIKYNLVPKIHANELDFSGGIQTGVRNNALSVDHLEFTGKEEIDLLLNSSTMPTLLPSTAFFLKLKYAPARNMIDSGLPVALASDFNPGSSPSGNIPFVLSLACLYMNMTPEEAINAATINSAYAMNLSDSHGSITTGKMASFFITNPSVSPILLPYSFGSNLVKKRFLAGKEY